MSMNRFAARIGRAAVCSALSFFLAACSSNSSSESTTNASADAGASEVDAATDVDPAAQAACDAETAKLQEGIDAAHGSRTDVTLAVKNETCGLRVLTSGPGKLDASRLHRIGSVTKTYVASVILSLAKEGVLSLEDPLSKWVDGVPNADVITVRQLMNHTSGIFNYTDDAAFFAKVFPVSANPSPRELVDAAVAHDPYFEPGKGWKYSNTNYVLLGMIAEKAAGAPIEVLIRQRVLSVIGAHATFFEGKEALDGELAVGRSQSGKDLTHDYNLAWAWAAGAMVATPADVVLWIEKLGSGTFYDADVQSQILATVEASSGTDYGLGVMVLRASATGGNGRAIGHGGDIPGFHTQAFYFPEKMTTVVAITNSERDMPNALTIVAIETLFGLN